MPRRKQKVPAGPSHANRYDGLTWCAARQDWSPSDVDLEVVGEMGPPENLDAITCKECLSRIIAYGELAARQLHKITGDRK